MGWHTRGTAQGPAAALAAALAMDPFERGESGRASRSKRPKKKSAAARSHVCDRVMRMYRDDADARPGARREL